MLNNFNGMNGKNLNFWSCPIIFPYQGILSKKISWQKVSGSFTTIVSDIVLGTTIQNYHSFYVVAPKYWDA